MRFLPYGERKKGRRVDAVLHNAGQMSPSTTASRTPTRGAVHEGRQHIAVVSLAALSVVGLVTAYKIDTQSPYSGATAAVVGSKGNQRVPFNYRTVCESLGSWAVA